MSIHGLGLSGLSAAEQLPGAILDSDELGSSLPARKRIAMRKVRKYEEVKAKLDFRACMQHALKSDELADVGSG